MKTIGLLGGMSWKSSILYYQIINEKINLILGGVHSAKCILYSVDFEEIEKYQHNGQWDKAADIMMAAAKGLEKAGADFLVICTNTMHKLADKVQAGISIPLLHIADAAARKIITQKIKICGLLATQFTMEEDFYKNRLKEKYNLDVLVPGLNDRKIIHKIIYEELVQGIIKPESRLQFIRIINDLIKDGAKAVILGCTEICLLIKADDVSVPLFDTTSIHAEDAVNLSLSK